MRTSAVALVSVALSCAGGNPRATLLSPEAPCASPLQRNSPEASSATIRSRVSKICSLCGKKPGFGNNRSHSMVATKRRFNPNLQKVRMMLNGKATRAYVCTRCLKAGKVTKAI